ncbi:mitochondrial fission process protein 1-like [Choristoneura fumiferana]|uniref:mitochondrial fission process protein 1-like n=1 Tax=Choristoneura fumiferana TaxID=7141 RepID=UPI003D15564B
MAKQKDMFRDTWVRYLGYANEVGEAFRPVVPARVVAYSYAIAFGYVFADTADKSTKMIRQDGRPRSVAIATGDAILWQTFASVIIPGYTINRISAFTGRGVKKFGRVLPSFVGKGITVAVALCCIPIIVSPIDHMVTFAMNHTYRMWYKP